MRKFGMIGVLAICAAGIAMPAAAQLRPMVYAEETVDAPIAQVWQDWTTSEGVERFFAPKAIIDARPGGDYILHFAPEAPEGSRGNDAGKVLGLQNQRMINLTWAMPPYLTEIRGQDTVLQLQFVPVDGDTTRIRIFHTGFGDGAVWRKGRGYFARTWPEVLDAYEASLTAE